MVTAAACRGRLPGPLQGLLPRAHRIRPALLPGLVRRARPGPADREAAAPGAVHPVDARDPPVQALHRPRLVAAIVDRVTFNAHILETGTQPYRLRTSKTTSRSRKPS